MASDCSSSSRFSRPDVDYHYYEQPEKGDELLRRIREYDQTVVDALERSLAEEDFNLTAHLITQVYPQWRRNLVEIQKYRSDKGLDFWNRNPDSLFDFAVNSMVAMPQALSRAKLNTQAEKRAWMPVLLRTLNRLSKAPWIRYRGKDHLLRHIDAISYFRMKNFPLNQAAWSKGELAGNPEFEKIFAEFNRLVANGQPKSEYEGRGLVHSSVNLVLDAARALLISLDAINIPLEKLVNEATRPTCVDKPITEPLFFSGTKEQPGAIAMKAYLGCPQKESESQFPLDGSVDYSGEKRDFGVFSDPATAAKFDEYVAKRQALVGRKGGNAGPTKQNKNKSTSCDDHHYRYTIEDADADIEDLQALVEGSARTKAVVTPVHAMPADVLAKYRATILPNFNEWAWAREAGLAGRPDQMSLDLARLEQEIESQRAFIVAARQAGRFNYANLKVLKCTALVLRYLRSLYMRLFLAARPTDDLLQARADRLADWILHEEVWNDATRYSLKMAKANSKLGPQHRRDLKAREANIEEWRTQLLALQKDIVKKQHAKADEDEEASEEELGGTAPAGPAPPVSLPETPKREVEDLDYGAYLDEPELVLSPTRYRARMRRPIVRGETRNEYHWVTKENREKQLVKGDKKKRNKQKPPKLAVFSAKMAEGPKGYQDLPREKVYDKLQYMIILTFWRVLQAQVHNL